MAGASDEEARPAPGGERKGSGGSDFLLDKGRRARKIAQTVILIRFKSGLRIAAQTVEAPACSVG